MISAAIPGAQATDAELATHAALSVGDAHGAAVVTFLQTYNTASLTHPAPTAETLTDNSGGSADTTIASVPATVAASVDATAAQLTATNTSLTAIRNNLADLTAMVNKLTADNLAQDKVIVSLIDELQRREMVG